MISSREPADVSDLLRKEAGACCLLAIQSVAQYAVEFDAGEHAQFVANLALIEQQWHASVTPEEMRSTQSSFRGELREYRDHSRDRLSQLRRQLDDSAQALTDFIAGIESNGSDHEHTLQREMKRLNAAADFEDVGQIRSVIREAVAGITISIEQIRSGNHLVILQLQDEIRTLHREFQAERRVLFTDPRSGAWTRQKLDGRIDELIRQDQSFGLLFISIRDFKGMEQRYSRTLVDGALKALVQRFQAAVGVETMVGRWGDEEFVAVTDLPASAALALSRETATALTGCYTVQENARAHLIPMEVTTTVISRGGASDAAGFGEKLDQLAATLAGA